MAIRFIFAILALLIVLVCAGEADPTTEQTENTTESNEDLEKETEEIVRGIMDAFQGSIMGSLADEIDEDGEKVIVQQEEKIVDANGNVKIKQRTLKNPSKEELETKTLEELEDDEDDPTITTIQTIRLNLNDNDLSHHTFSTFGLTDPKDVSNTWLGQDQTVTGYVKSFFWFLIKVLTILAIGLAIFKLFRLENKLKNFGFRKSKRYDQEDGLHYSDEDEHDEEELSNIRNAVKRGEKAKNK